MLLLVEEGPSICEAGYLPSNCVGEIVAKYSHDTNKLMLLLWLQGDQNGLFQVKYLKELAVLATILAIFLQIFKR